NIADHGGLQIAFHAFQNATGAQARPGAQASSPAKNAPSCGNVEGLCFTPEQRFFLAYANVWAGNIRPEEILNRTKSDPHSLGRWRVNGALPHIGAWYDAWHVTPESPMYLAPENRVSIW
ncbi:MAG: M13-type metalloendopeptidase, partial [Paludibacteraceae bacterium]